MDQLDFALSTGETTLKVIIASGREVTLKINLDVPASAGTSIPYRYDSTDKLSETFLKSADPGTGLGMVLVVEHVIAQLEGKGYAVSERKKVGKDNVLAIKKK